MRGKHRLTPRIDDRLEPRIVLSQGIAIAPIAVAPLNASGRARALNTAAIQSINDAFDSFSRDYMTALGAYFNGGEAPAGESVRPAKDQYARYVLQRIDLLAQELTRTFSHLPKATRPVAGAPRGSIVLQVFLRSQITGTQPGTLRTNLVGSNFEDNAQLLPAPGGEENIASLYTARSLNAVETARAATTNAAGFLLRGTFKHGGR
ncbi:hypothetical protein [Paludisphaera sp.]|uniref:hypothetical protein n=1 Tax=Paludisphaera sp. TaxID=2017432 RepID=UPI00301DF0E0